MSSPPLFALHNPQVHTDSLEEQVEEEMEMREQEPLVFHHHYLPCPVTSLSPMSLWPSSFLSVPPHQPPRGCLYGPVGGATLAPGSGRLPLVD